MHDYRGASRLATVSASRWACPSIEAMSNGQTTVKRSTALIQMARPASVHLTPARTDSARDLVHVEVVDVRSAHSHGSPSSRRPR